MFRKLAVPGLAAGLAFAPAAVHAGPSASPAASVRRVEDPAVLDPIVVTATRFETPARELASSVTVITREEIEAGQKSSVYDVLRGHPALDVVRTGGLGGNTAVFMRGAKSEHTLVLIDGVEANDPSAADHSFDLGNLSVDNVERIEILRGPQGPLYGSDAIGGVIHVITRKGSGRPSVFALTEGGAYRTARAQAGVSGGTSRVRYSLEGSRAYAGGFSSASERAGNGERDGYGDSSASGRFGVELSKALGLELAARSGDARAEIDGSGGDDPNYAARNRRLFVRGQARLDLGEGFLVQRAGVSAIRHDRDFTNGTDPLHPASSSRSRFDGRSFKADWQGDLRLLPSNILTLGAETERETAETENLSSSSFGTFASRFEDKVARTNGYFIQDQVRLGSRFFATLGARTDDHDRFGSAGTWRATAAWWPVPLATKLKATYGTGFKAPSLFQLYSSFGNADLEPEKSAGWDAGVEQTLGGGASAGITYFRNDFSRMIVFDGASSRYANADRAFSRGVEVFGTWRPSAGLSLRADHTVTEAKDKATGETLIRRPRNKSGASVDWRPGRAEVHAGAVYVGPRDDLDFSAFPAARVRLASYAVFDLGGAYELFPRVRVFGRVENLFDREYEEVLGYGTPGRAFYAGVKVSL